MQYKKQREKETWGMFVSLNLVCVDKKINGVYALVGKRELFCIVD